MPSSPAIMPSLLAVKSWRASRSHVSSASSFPTRENLLSFATLLGFAKWDSRPQRQDSGIESGQYARVALSETRNQE
jgi:hypothetical protein